jgi:hypothetical protein
MNGKVFFEITIEMEGMRLMEQWVSDASSLLIVELF